MAGSIDLNTNKGIAIVLLVSGMVGGGASVLQNQVFGPGGEWQRVVTNQAVIQEQIKTQSQSFDKLSNVLETGFAKVAESTEKQNLDLKQIQYEIESLKTRMNALEQFRLDLSKRQIP